MIRRYYCIKQQSKNDCGCACLATICKTYGLNNSLYMIRNNIDINGNNGVSALSLLKSAERLGFNTRGIKAQKFEDIFSEDIPLPAIAHVIIDKKISHYVVIHKISKNEIIIADPEKGIIKYYPNDFFSIWTGVLLIMVPNNKFNLIKKRKNILYSFFELIKHQKGLLINIFLASLLITTLGILGAFYFKILLDDIIPNNLKYSLVTFSIGFIVLATCKVVLEGFRGQIFLYLSQRIDIPLMLGYYNHVIKLPMEFFDNRKIGEIISRFNDAAKIREAISGITLTMMIDLIMVLVGAVILFYENSFLFGITIIPLILYCIIVSLFKGSIENSNRMVMDDNAKLTSFLVESMNGIETIKSFNLETESMLETENRFIKLMKSIFKNGTVNNIQVSLKSGVKEIFAITILWIGTYQVLNGKISFGELLTFNALLVYFLNPIENIINLQPTIQKAIVAAERLIEILNIELEETEEDKNKIKVDSLDGDIEFNNVWFKYEMNKWILNDINMKIEKGSRIAFIGESGSGKTTIAKLLLKFYNTSKGSIKINSYAIEDISNESLRNKIAYVSQEPFLFSGSIIENLIVGNQRIKYEDVIEACKKAQINDYICSLPLRYNTLIEENGSNLSGGQKQRLAIARALLRNPEILIMDEATSNLDSITEKAIQNMIHEFSEGMTTIIIAHRLSTIKDCDNIFVLENGVIIEQGVHKELLDLKGKYYKLWKEQFS